MSATSPDPRTRTPEVPTPTPATLEFESVDKSFVQPNGQRLQVLDACSFAVGRNDFCAVVGPSGCGKSTLFRLATGLDSPTSGTARFKGSVIDGINTQIGYVTQEAKLFPWFTLQENLELPLKIRNVPRAERADRVRHFLDVARLRGFEDHYPHQLSGGMQKRASIVRTLIYEPEVILMDEPFGALDAQTRMLMHKDLLDLWQAHQSTVVFITHDLAEAVTLADNVVVLTRRPTSVKTQVAIPLERPRNVFEPHDMPGYGEAYDHLWSILKSEVVDIED